MSVKKLICGVLLILPPAGFVHAVVQVEPKEQQQSTVKDRSTGQKAFMRKKLSATQKIIEGLATDNFGLIEQAADELLAIRESAQWEVSGDPFYSYYSRDFESRVDELKAAAKKQSPEEATFAYTHVTMSCTACHQRVRRVTRIAR